MKNQDPIKKKETVNDFERRANRILITSAIIIFAVLGIGIFLAVAKPDTKINDLVSIPSGNLQNGKSPIKSDRTVKGESKGQTQKQESKTEEKAKDNQTEAQKNQNKETVDLSKQKVVTVDIKTAKGDIKVALYPELMPITVDNFVQLMKKNFYNGLTFHRVEDWVIQGGDPKGDSTGGSGKNIKLETNPNLKNVRGAIAMAHSADKDSASSQFYILKKDAAWLDGDFAVFGKVMSGIEIVDKIAIGDKITEIKEVK